MRQHFEEIQRGNMAWPMWAYRTIERRHPVLASLISCCESPVENFEWDIRPKKQLPDGFDEADAEAQAKVLKAAYASIDNIKEAVTHLIHADFPGFAHIQKHRADGQVVHLECLHQYCFAKDGLFGDWFWNPDSLSTDSPLRTLGESNRIGGETLPREDFIIREVTRPINEIALENFVRRKLIEKNWTAFGELFGLPSGMLTMPENIPQDRVAEVEAQAIKAAEAGSGAVPFGCEWKVNTPPHDGSALFKGHTDQLDADLVMAGTGGKLKMLVEKGAGDKRGSSGAQDDTFYEIAQARGNKVAECFHRDFDVPFLAEKFPLQPALVEFCLVTKDDVDAGALITNSVALKGAGYPVDAKWLEEQTGYVLDVAQMAANKVAAKAAEDAALNTEPDAEEIAPQIQNRLSIVNRKLAKIRAVSDPELQREMIDALAADCPALADAFKEEVEA